MKIYKKFRLIKEFPRSPILGTIRVFNITSETEFNKELAELKLCELYKEFWEIINE